MAKLIPKSTRSTVRPPKRSAKNIQTSSQSLRVRVFEAWRLTQEHVEVEATERKRLVRRHVVHEIEQEECLRDFKGVGSVQVVDCRGIFLVVWVGKSS
jgi:hypothetical protein